MNTRLKHIQDWLELAKEANWSVSELATRMGVSSRTLNRYFKIKMGKTPKIWLAEHRQRQAMSLLEDGYSVKEAAAALGYKHPHNFSRRFKDHWGQYPTTISSV